MPDTICSIGGGRTATATRARDPEADPRLRGLVKLAAEPVVVDAAPAADGDLIATSRTESTIWVRDVDLRGERSSAPRYRTHARSCSARMEIA